MPRLTTTLLAAAATTVALAAPPVFADAAASSQTVPARAPIAWHTCESHPDFQCGTMRVPLDYDHPRAAKIKIALIRHLAGNPAHRKGVIFWNAGGPGGAPTSGLPAIYDSFAPSMRNNLDVVSMDPRGIGESTPLTCFASPKQEAALLGKLPPGFPVGRAEVRRTVRVYHRFDQACARHGGPIQFHMSTANVARDMDRLRARLGLDKLNYYGPSYGTYLGATYANLFPRHVGRLVLDGNAPPVEWNDARAGRHLNTFLRIGSPYGALRGLRMFLRKCGAVDTSRCALSAGSPAATAAKYRDLLARLRTDPVTVDGIPFTYAQTATLVGGLLESQVKTSIAPGWKTLAALVQTLWQQSRSTTPVPVPADVDQLLKDLGQQGGGGPEGTLGVLCGESPNPRDPYSYQRQGRIGNAGTPYGLGDVWSALAQPCAEWQARDTDRYTGPWDRSTPPILVIGTLGDSNTAYTGAVRMAQELSNARLLTETGGGHTAMINKSSCIDARVDRFLLDGVLPAVGTVCDQDRAPF